MKRRAAGRLPVILSNLGATYFHAGRLREAEVQLVGALTYWSSSDKPSEDLGKALYNLAAVYRTQARYTEATPLYERALAVNEELVGPTELSNIPILNGIGLLYDDTAEYTRAQQIMERAISIIELGRAENTPDAATSFATLGMILEAQGSVNKAETWFLRALEVREHLFGQNDPIVADTRVGLALVYHRENRLAEAADLNIRAIATYQERRESKNLPAALNNLGRIRTGAGAHERSSRATVSQGNRPVGTAARPGSSERRRRSYQSRASALLKKQIQGGGTHIAPGSGHRPGALSSEPS